MLLQLLQDWKDLPTGWHLLTRYSQGAGVEDFHQLDEVVCFPKVSISDSVQSTKNTVYAVELNVTEFYSRIKVYEV